MHGHLATLSATAIAENNDVGATIGTLSANDPGAGGAFTFSLPAGVADNAAFTIAGDVLKAAAAFDYETNAHYVISVQVTHTSGLSYDKSFTVEVNNIVEAAAVYVDDDWGNLTAGAVISDADPARAGDQPATFGVDAFAALPAAALVVDAGGTGRIVLADGAYAGNFALDRPMAFDVAGAATVSGIIDGGFPLVKQGPGILTLTGANLYSGGTTIDAGTLQIGNGGAAGSIGGNVANQGVLSFNRSDSVSFAGVISGAGEVLKAGAGALALGAANTFQGGVTVNRGALLVSANNQLGNAAGPVNIVSPGRLTVTADMPSSRQFFLQNATLQINAGVTLTLANAEMNGGFLSGPGVLATSAGAAFATTFAGATSQTSLTIDARGADKFVAFTNNGSIALSNQAATTLDGFNNSTFGRLAVNGVTRVRDFTTLGQMTVNGLVDNIGASDLGFSGVTTINPSGIVNLHAVNALIAGGLVKNNGAFGSSSNTIRVDFDGYLKGTGAFGNVVTQNGGVYAPGNSPGGATTNQYNLNGGGALEFEVSNATGVAGNSSGWDLVAVRPTIFNPLASVVSLTATPGNRYTIRLTSRLDAGDRTASGPATYFDPAQPYAWKFADIDGAAMVGAFDSAAFAIDASAFRNAFTGAFSVELRDGSKSLAVVYTPQVAPTTLTLLATPNATTGGELVSFTATVNPNPGNRGVVTFVDGNAVINGGDNVALVNGVATFQTSSLTAGSHTVRADDSGAEDFAASTSNTISFAVAASAPQLVSVTPNGDSAGPAAQQRSRVTCLVVTFNQPVQLDAGAMALALHTNIVVYGGISQPSGMGTVPASLNVSSTDNVAWTLTFAGAGTVETGADGQSSLKDGVYDFNINAAKVHPLGNPAANMGSNSTTTFHRLFGDTDAPSTPSGGTVGVDFSAVVNSGDNFAFRTAFNSAASHAPFLDFDGNGLINTGDNFEIRNRFNKTLTWRV